MSLKSLISLRSFGILILAVFLALCCLLLWNIHKYDKQSSGELQKYSMFLNKYKIQRSDLWNKAFETVSKQKYTQVNFLEKGHSLIIGQKYITEIGHQGQYYDQQTISNVVDLSSESSTTKHFLVRSEINQQIFYASQVASQSVDAQQYAHLQKCLELDNIELKEKLHHFVDSSDKFWLVSHPHNNVLFIQVYDCQNKKLVKKIFHEPVHNNRKYMINEIISVNKLEDDSYEVKILTYESHEYVVRIKGITYQIQQASLNPSYSITSDQLPINKKSDQTSGSLISYLFFDPLNKIFEQQFNHLVFSTIKDFTDEVRMLLGGLGVDTKTLNSFIRDKLKEYEREKVPEYLDYDIQLADQNNDCITNLQYHIPVNSSQTNSSLTRLSKYLLDTRTPVFHSVDNYDQYDIVQILKNEKTPEISQFKRLSIDKGYEKQYVSHHFHSVYHTYPDSRIHFMGLGQKVFYMHPKQNARDEDFISIRSKTGALIMHGGKIKGVYEDRPLGKTEQVRQKYFIQGNQVLPGIYQAHTGYQSLYSVLNGNKVELVNGLSGKTMVTFPINIKQGYQYAGSYLFNSEWWVIQYNTETKLSELTKHELYVQKSYPKQIDTTKRTYGKLDDSELSEGEDDLATIFKEYTHQVSNDGIVILDVFRCLDEFYYIQLCDTKGKNYAIARIHYKRLSNRLPTTYQKYGSDLEQRLIVQPKDMVKEKQKMDPFLLVLEGQQFFQGIQVLIKQNKFNFKNYSVKSGDTQKVISSMEKLNQFQFLPYVMLSEQQIQGVWTDSVKSTQEILLLNMRVLVQNAKKKFMVETKQLARTRLKYFGVFISIILLCLIIKLAISDKMKKIIAQKQSVGQQQQKASPSQKGKNKKEKTK